MVPAAAASGRAPSPWGRFDLRADARRSLELGLLVSGLIHFALLGACLASRRAGGGEDPGRAMRVQIRLRPIVDAQPVFIPPAREGRAPAPNGARGTVTPVTDFDLSRLPFVVSGDAVSGESKPARRADPGPGTPPRPAPGDDAPMAIRFAEILPVPLEAPRPVYPDWAQEAGIEGRVVLHVRVGADGTVREVRVVRGVTGLDAEAVRTVKRWRFEPARTNGVPVEVWVELPIDFRL